MRKKSVSKRKRNEGKGKTNGEPLLSNDGASVTLSATEVTELLVVGVRLVLVVGDGGGTVELQKKRRVRKGRKEGKKGEATHRGDSDVVDGKTPDGEGAAEGSDGGVVAVEHTVGRESLGLLTLRLALDGAETLGDEGGRVRLATRLDLELEELGLVLEPLRDLLAAELELAATVTNVEDGRGELGRDLASGTHDTATGSGDGATGLVSGGGGVGDDTVDGSTHVDGSLRRHEDLSTATLRLHCEGEKERERRTRRNSQLEERKRD
jgi:hypothetical protein